MISWPTPTMKLKQALDLLLTAYEPQATLNDINIILSLVLSNEDDEEFMREEDEDPCICVEDHIDVNCPSCF